MSTVGFPFGEIADERLNAGRGVAGHLNPNLWGGFSESGWLQEPVSRNSIGVHLKYRALRSTSKTDAVLAYPYKSGQTLSDFRGTLLFEGTNLNGMPYNRWDWAGFSDLAFGGGQIDAETIPWEMELESCAGYSNDTTGSTIAAAASAPESVLPEEMAYVLIEDRKVNTSAQELTASVWNVRELNTITIDTASIASLATNIITLPAGTYRFRVKVPSYRPDWHQARITLISPIADNLYGTAEYSNEDHLTQTSSWVVARHTFAATQTLQIQHYITGSVGTLKGGLGSTSTAVNIYTQVEIWKEP